MTKKARHTVLGKAFEYACAISLRDVLCHGQSVVIEQSPQFKLAEGYYINDISKEEQERILNAARAGIRLLLRYEPQLMHPNGNEPLIVELESDKRGQAGDVRDVLFIRKQNDWEIGISCKHNHSAVKHSRISDKTDFGKVWFGIPCAHSYFDSISPIFSELRRIRKESNGTAKWDVIGDENAKQELYKTVLTAFASELKRLDEENPGLIAPSLIGYLIGMNDFYKLIAIDKDKLTEMQAYNIHGTLNRVSGSNKSVSDIRKIKLPTKFHKIDFLEEHGVTKFNTLAIYCDCGWEISLRLHNASSRVEPSLKFDVQLITYPKEIRSQVEPWV